MISQTGFGVSQNAKYLTVFFIKLVLVPGVVTIFLYTVIFGIEPTGEETPEEKEGSTCTTRSDIPNLLCAAD